MKAQHLLTAMAILTLVACKKEEVEAPSDPVPPAPTERDLVMQDYTENYLPGNSFVPATSWNGSVTNCDPGEVPADLLDQVLQRINYFRRLVGLNDNITWDLPKMQRCQEAALMMDANNTLDHDPPNTWSCWTQLGNTGAGQANLAMQGGVQAITSFISDYGPGNAAAGHRRWILHSTKTKLAYGSTTSATALGVIGTTAGNQEIPDFIAYPPAGYVPHPLVFSRWSFGIPGGNFGSAMVSMTDADGAAIPLTIVSRVTGYGDNTIVWEPAIPTSGTADASYTVTIGDIGNADETSYTYTVISALP